VPIIDPEEMLPDRWKHLTPEQQKTLIRDIKYNWTLWARPNQVVDWTDNDWDILLVLAGRGFGKTRMGAEAVRQFCLANPGSRVAITAPTYGSARDVCFEGDSGLLEVSSPEEIDKAAGGKYNRSLGQLKYTNGSLCQWYSGGDPERFRGPQHHLIWADELCAWEKAQETWDMMLMGLRLGAHPRIIITTTPKPSPLIIELVKRANEGDVRVKIVTGSTFDNSANLPSSALDALRARYEGTTLGRQELYAELILDSPGALWSREAIEINRVRMYEYDAEGNELVTGDVPSMNRIVVAVDPAMSAKGDRVAETGIVVAGVGSDGHGYVLEDATMENATPDQWAHKAIEMYHKWQADKIVYEKNQGGDLIRHTFQTIDDRLPLKWVVASKGKALRAEPVSALYEQGRVHHVGNFPALEDQMAFWDPNEGNNRTNSPDRVDALVWAFTELMLGGGGGELSVPWATEPSDPTGGAWGGFAIPRM
jgi:phage terminase large subunit-like protein